MHTSDFACVVEEGQLYGIPMCCWGRYTNVLRPMNYCKPVSACKPLGSQRSLTRNTRLDVVGWDTRVWNALAKTSCFSATLLGKSFYKDDVKPWFWQKMHVNLVAPIQHTLQESSISIVGCSKRNRTIMKTNTRTLVSCQ